MTDDLQSAIDRIKALLPSVPTLKVDLDVFSDDDLEACIADESCDILFTSATSIKNDGTSKSWDLARQTVDYRTAELLALARNHMEAILDALKQAQDDNRKVVCVYCGNVREYADRETMIASIAEHVADCPKHPLKMAEETLAAFTDDLQRDLAKANDELARYRALDAQLGERQFREDAK